MRADYRCPRRVIAFMPRCCGQICPRQRAVHFAAAMPQAGDMAHDEKNPLFSERVRDQLRHQRVLVLDGVLDDDNGTLLATQLLTLAAEDPAADIEVQAADLRHMVDTVLGIIADDTGQPVERIFDDSLHDHWYTAAEAREYGFIDEIVDSFGQVMPARKHRVGLTSAS